jgi:hypothetical protein
VASDLCTYAALLEMALTGPEEEVGWCSEQHPPPPVGTHQDLEAVRIIDGSQQLHRLPALILLLLLLPKSGWRVHQQAFQDLYVLVTFNPANREHMLSDTTTLHVLFRAVAETALPLLQIHGREGDAPTVLTATRESALSFGSSADSVDEDSSDSGDGPKFGSPSTRPFGKVTASKRSPLGVLLSPFGKADDVFPSDSEVDETVFQADSKALSIDVDENTALGCFEMGQKLLSSLLAENLLVAGGWRGLVQMWALRRSTSSNAATTSALCCIDRTLIVFGAAVTDEISKASIALKVRTPEVKQRQSIFSGKLKNSIDAEDVDDGWLWLRSAMTSPLVDSVRHAVLVVEVILLQYPRILATERSKQRSSSRPVLDSSAASVSQPTHVPSVVQIPKSQADKNKVESFGRCTLGENCGCASFVPPTKTPDTYLDIESEREMSGDSLDSLDFSFMSTSKRVVLLGATRRPDGGKPSCGQCGHEHALLEGVSLHVVADAACVASDEQLPELCEQEVEAQPDSDGSIVEPAVQQSACVQPWDSPSRSMLLLATHALELLDLLLASCTTETSPTPPEIVQQLLREPTSLCTTAVPLLFSCLRLSLLLLSAARPGGAEESVGAVPLSATTNVTRLRTMSMILLEMPRGEETDSWLLLLVAGLHSSLRAISTRFVRGCALRTERDISVQLSWMEFADSLRLILGEVVAARLALLRASLMYPEALESLSDARLDIYLREERAPSNDDEDPAFSTTEQRGSIHMESMQDESDSERLRASTWGSGVGRGSMVQSGTKSDSSATDSLESEVLGATGTSGNSKGTSESSDTQGAMKTHSLPEHAHSRGLVHIWLRCNSLESTLLLHDRAFSLVAVLMQRETQFTEGAFVSDQQLWDEVSSRQREWWGNSSCTSLEAAIGKAAARISQASNVVVQVEKSQRIEIQRSGQERWEAVMNCRPPIQLGWRTCSREGSRVNDEGIGVTHIIASHTSEKDAVESSKADIIGTSEPEVAGEKEETFTNPMHKHKRWFVSKHSTRLSGGTDTNSVLSGDAKPSATVGVAGSGALNVVDAAGSLLQQDNASRPAHWKLSQREDFLRRHMVLEVNRKFDTHEKHAYDLMVGRNSKNSKKLLRRHSSLEELSLVTGVASKVSNDDDDFDVVDEEGWEDIGAPVEDEVTASLQVRAFVLSDRISNLLFCRGMRRFCSGHLTLNWCRQRIVNDRLQAFLPSPLRTSYFSLREPLRVSVGRSAQCMKCTQGDLD